jgi:hypothetical protein
MRYLILLKSLASIKLEHKKAREERQVDSKTAANNRSPKWSGLATPGAYSLLLQVNLSKLIFTCKSAARTQVTSLSVVNCRLGGPNHFGLAAPVGVNKFERIKLIASAAEKENKSKSGAH